MRATLQTRQLTLMKLNTCGSNGGNDVANIWLGVTDVPAASSSSCSSPCEQHQQRIRPGTRVPLACKLLEDRSARGVSSPTDALPHA